MTDQIKKAVAELGREQTIQSGLCDLVERGLLTPNEVRAFFGLPSADNGDALR